MANKKANNNPSDKLIEALTKFQREYPNTTSGDLQTFMMGARAGWDAAWSEAWNEAMESMNNVSVKEKSIKMYGGDMIAKYQETDEKKQMLWDAFIKWCEEHNASSGESYQNDNFQIDAPEFMADAIDKIVIFEVEWD